MPVLSDLIVRVRADTVGAVGALGVLGLGLAGVGVGAAAAATAMVRMGMDAQNQLGIVAGLTGATAQQMQYYTTSLQGLAVKYGDSLSATAKGLYYVVSAGYQGKDAIDVLTAAMLHASATGVPLQEVANGLTSAMNSYGAKAQEASRYSDILTTAITYGKQTTADFANNVSKAALMAASAHVPFTQLAAAEASLTEKGEPANRAFTELSFMISKIAVPSAESMGKAVSAAGGHLNETAYASADLMGKLLLLRNSTGLSEDAFLKLVGGTRSARGALGLLADGGEAYRKIMVQMGNDTGVTAAAFAIHSHTMEFGFQQVQGAVSVLGFKLVQMISPAVVPFLGSLAAELTKLPGQIQSVVTAIAPFVLAAGNVLAGIKSVVDFITNHEITLDLFRGTLISIGLAMATIQTLSLIQSLIALGGALVAGIPALLTTNVVLWGTVPAAGAAQASLWGLAAAEAAVALPLWVVIAVIAAVALAITGIILLITHWGQVTTWLAGVWKDTQTVLGNVWKAISDTATTVWRNITGFFQHVWDNVSGWFKTTWSNITTYLSTEWGNISTTAKNIWGGIGNIFTTAGTGISTFFTTLWRGITIIVQTVWQGIIDWLRPKVQAAVDVLSGPFNWFKTFFQGLWDTISSIVRVAWDIIIKLFQLEITALSSVWHSIWDPISTYAEQVWGNISGAVGKWLNDQGAKVKDAWTTTGNWLSDRWNWISGTADRIWSGATKIVGAWWTQQTTDAHNTWTGTGNWLHDRWQWVSDTAGNIWGGVTKIAKAWWDQQSSDLHTVWTTTGNWLHDRWQWISDTATTVWNNLLKFFGDMGGKIRDTVMAPFNFIRDHIGDVFKAIGNFALDQLRSAIAGISSFINGFVSAINWVADALHLPSSDRAKPWNPPTIPRLAAGTGNWPGGIAQVGEAGNELVKVPGVAPFLTGGSTILNLPPGTQVVNATTTNAMLGRGGSGDPFGASQVWNMLTGGVTSFVSSLADRFGIRLTLPGDFAQDATALVKEAVDGLKNLATGWANLAGGGGGGPVSALDVQAWAQLGSRGGTPWFMSPYTQVFGQNGETGIDIGTPFHTPISALFGGTIYSAAYGPWGGEVKASADGYGTNNWQDYIHFDIMNPALRTGMSFGPGFILGMSGGENPGYPGAHHPASPQFSSGPHTEFGMYHGGPHFAGGVAMNPINIINAFRAGMHSFDTGGWINEPIVGVGASGQRYGFGLNGRPEYVSPASSAVVHKHTHFENHFHGSNLTPADVVREQYWQATLHGGGS